MREVTAKTADKVIIDLRKVKPEDLGLIVIELHAVTDRRDVRNATLRIDALPSVGILLADSFKLQEAAAKQAGAEIPAVHQEAKFIGG